MRIWWVALALVMTMGTACSGSAGAPPAEPEASASVVLDVTSGRPLSEFEGTESYEWRKALVAVQVELLERMKGVADFLDEGDFSDVLGTCSAIAGGVSDQQLIDETMTRFSGGTGTVDQGQAQALIALAQAYVCPV